MPDDVTPAVSTEGAAAQGEPSVEKVGEAPAKPRRRRRTKAEMEAARAAEAAARAAAEAAGEPWPPKRRRGRPRKSEQVAAAASEQAQSGAASAGTEAAPAPVAAPAAEAVAQEAPAPKRRRGRPRKSETAPVDEMTKVTQDATVASSEPTEMPSQTLAPAAETADAPEEAAHQGDAPRPGRKRRHQKDHQSGDATGGEKGGNAGSQQGQGGQGRRQNGRDRRRNRRQDFVAEPSLTRDELAAMKVAELRAKAAELEIDYAGVRKGDLVEAVYAAAARAEGFRSVDGILEIGNEGYGWVRTGNYMEGDDDAFVHQQIIRSLGLRPGDRVAGTVGPGRANSKYPPLQSVTSVNGHAPENLKSRPRFRDLTPVYPNERLVMECGKDSITGRAIDLVSPIGKGQRGLIVSPPKAGKTTVLKKICQSIAANNPEVHLFCLLVDERPEEVTDMERSIKGEVVASTFDMPADNHTHVSELVIEHAKRLVELGEDVVVVLDSITRLARAYNLAQPASGRILSGGVDSAALYPPKKFLGAARNIENGGSLTIIASALVDTGSKMDEVIFEEFKGTGNMELKLDRELADKRIFPAIDPVASGTRNEDLLISPEYQPLVWGIRRILANMNNVERAANALVRGLKETDSNSEFLIKSAKKAAQSGYVG
ncbi:transcription termination factor Rho [Thermophilibacter provencensis]|uniref:Transcription termination factor Rho n=1 Tax=Thermophilibacter provencensis TaxID=1852386 RepID=A0ABT7V5F5_9ACTN|nr:transcription termination factor Rho [Thermophilibacter provencensis]MDM8271206.1 transcription termination factor Rho [Thermophilibacter provencensis]